jgi:hypothetical protein
MGDDSDDCHGTYTHAESNGVEVIWILLILYFKSFVDFVCFVTVLKAITVC